MSATAANVPRLEVSADDPYVYDEQLHKTICQQRPWKSDPHYFKHVKISASSMIKMVSHARSGGALEVMGIMIGKVTAGTMIVTDAFPLPVTGTETRVNAGAEAMEYMVQYLENSKRVGRRENAIGWYHSHPGYGCWLSGIDVSTQLLNQTYQEPWLAVVIDPVRTQSSGKVSLGAFRTYPEGYTPPNAEASQFQSIPLNKIEDFGVHSNRYYELSVSYYRSQLDSQLIDLLWEKCWVDTLSSSAYVQNRQFANGQINDLVEKIAKAESGYLRSNSRFAAGSLSAAPTGPMVGSTSGVTRSTRGGGGGSGNGGAAAGGVGGGDGGDGGRDDALLSDVSSTWSELQRETLAASQDELHGVMFQVLKRFVFAAQQPAEGAAATIATHTPSLCGHHHHAAPQ